MVLHFRSMRCPLLLMMLSCCSCFMIPSFHPCSMRPRLLRTTTSRLYAHRMNAVQSERSHLNVQTNDANVGTNVGTNVQILPAKRPLHSFFTDQNQEFSILSWNILLPNSQDNWWNHKMYAPWVPMEKRMWSHRQALIRERLLLSGADIICIQEADGETFETDFAFMEEAGYQHCLHTKYRFRCATFFKGDKFVLEQDAHKDRTLVTALRSTTGNRILNVVNCHLSGGAAPERRLRQVYEALEQIRKWKDKSFVALEKQRNANRPSPRNILKAEEAFHLQENAGVLVCGDFNSDGDTAVRRLLVDGSIDPHWREPQYPDVQLTSGRKENSLGHLFVDAAELAYAANVCDGDYGEAPAVGTRPATYVVPSLASLLLKPVGGDAVLRTQFGLQVAKGLAETLGLRAFCESEVNRAFETLDMDGNDLIDNDEIQRLPEAVYMATHGRLPTDDERRSFFSGFLGSSSAPGPTASGLPVSVSLSREQLTEKLLALHQELEGGIEGAELVEVRTEADAQRMMTRFTPVLRSALDEVFEVFASEGGDTMSEAQVEAFLIKANGELGRGGTARHTAAILERKREAGADVVLTRQDWYGVFARELGEGKWWQVVYDLEACGATLRGSATRTHADSDGTEHNLNAGPGGPGPASGGPGRHYQGWLDYLYFDSRRLGCVGVQDALTQREHERIYDEGDALPNEWHPSDHLPVAAVFAWHGSDAGSEP